MTFLLWDVGLGLLFSHKTHHKETSRRKRERDFFLRQTILGVHWWITFCYSERYSLTSWTLVSHASVKWALVRSWCLPARYNRIEHTSRPSTV